MVRPVRPDDVAAVRAIAAAVGAPDDAGLADPDERPTGVPAPSVAPDGFAALTEPGCSYLAEVGGRPVGYLLAQPIAYDGDAPLTLWVEHVAVHPDHRRRGIATALYRSLGDRAAAAGTTGVLTRVDPADAAAVALHRRVGFVPHAGDALVWRLAPD